MTTTSSSNKHKNEPPFFPPVFKERKKQWVHKATFTVIVSQLGLLILLIFIGPSDLLVTDTKDITVENSDRSEINKSMEANVNTQTKESQNDGFFDDFVPLPAMWWDTILDYLQKGSLLLSIMSLGANAAANYFWDVRKGKEGSLLFESNKPSFIVFLVLVFSAGIVYGVIPNQVNKYFILLQLIMFVMLILYIYKINYAIFYKEQSFTEEVDEEQNDVVTGTNKLNNSKYDDDMNGDDLNIQDDLNNRPAYADNSDIQYVKVNRTASIDDLNIQDDMDKQPASIDDSDTQDDTNNQPSYL